MPVLLRIGYVLEGLDGGFELRADIVWDELVGAPDAVVGAALGVGRWGASVGLLFEVRTIGLQKMIGDI